MFACEVVLKDRLLEGLFQYLCRWSYWVEMKWLKEKERKDESLERKLKDFDEFVEKALEQGREASLPSACFL